MGGAAETACGDKNQWRHSSTDLLYIYSRFLAFQSVVIVLKVVFASVFIPGAGTVDALLFQQLPSEIVPPRCVRIKSSSFDKEKHRGIGSTLHEKFSNWCRNKVKTQYKKCNKGRHINIVR
jgi:hypothetical protein